jgi:ATP-binding cassette subfamily C (CFTR/MRP) protein 1
MAMYDTFKTDFIIGGVGSLVANLIQLLMPFVLKYLIYYATDAFIADKTGGPAPNLGQGIGLVVGITLMHIFGSIGNNHFMYRGMIVGGQVRSVLISIIFDKALTISGRAKAGGSHLHDGKPANVEPGSEGEKQYFTEKLDEKTKREKKGKDEDEEADKKEEKKGWSNGRIVNLMSVDTYRIDQASGWFHMCWTSPIAICVTLTLLCINMTYSALPGFGLFFLSMPALAIAIGALFTRRTKINKITDERIGVTQEVLQAVRFVKFYGWESNFIARIQGMPRSILVSSNIAN